MSLVTSGMRVAEGVRSFRRSAALTQSFRMRPSWNPKSNFLERTCWGRRWVWRDMPDELLMTSRAVWASTPYLVRAMTPSEARRRWAALRTLLTALTALPAPRGPHLTIFDDQASMRSTASAKSSSLPPTIDVRDPVSAPTGPPETGASTIRTPNFDLSLSPSSTVAAGPPEVTSTMRVPLRNGADDSTSSTSAVVERHKPITSHSAASDAKSARYSAPISPLRASALDAVLDATSAGLPYFSRLYLCMYPAMDVPMVPRPYHPSVFVVELGTAALSTRALPAHSSVRRIPPSFITAQ
mmetsp:Transcript_4270/g.14138  ORF Transcript_4270/g.14138 Transcript_4270/m.14138 type:complete len:298 (-) Transcript_4270:899-1792(-)